MSELLKNMRKLQDCDVHLATFKLVAKEQLAGKTMIKEMGVSLLQLFVLSETHHQKSQ